MRLMASGMLATINCVKFLLLAVIATTILSLQPARADNVAGQVGTIITVGSGAGAPGNYDFRVYMATGAVICNGVPWVYINTSDANYSALVASVLLAKSLGSTVTLYFNQVGAYCQLAYIVMS